MRPDPLRDPGEDGQEPDRCLPPAGPQAEPGAGPGQQGLFLCLPAGSLDTDRFTQSGPAADMPPDPLLATIVDTVTGEGGAGLAGLSDDQLVGVIAAVRRLESRVAWYSMAAIREFAARNSGEGCAAEFAADQLACELHPIPPGWVPRPTRMTPASPAARMTTATAMAAAQMAAAARADPAPPAARAGALARLAGTPGPA